jgi:hypothetical protein
MPIVRRPLPAIENPFHDHRPHQPAIAGTER